MVYNLFLEKIKSEKQPGEFALKDNRFKLFDGQLMSDDDKVTDTETG